MSDASSASARVAELSELLRYHDRKYYVEARPEITDLEYDRLMKELQQLERDHPELATPDSPTQRVGDAPVPHLEQAAHRIPMLSIENVYDEDELKAYGERIAGELEGEGVGWVVEL
ncbi:MAG: NAD-dependent DNA ligase LigA, partial [Planctomycetales bacterium]|nr:NAD-dependent DNA ligase LigA [Planctomycetales bacterium]